MPLNQRFATVLQRGSILCTFGIGAYCSGAKSFLLARAPKKPKLKLADPQILLSAEVCTSPSAVVTQAIAATGADMVIIDQEHGAVGREAMHATIAATAGTDYAPLVRIAEMGNASHHCAIRHRAHAAGDHLSGIQDGRSR